MPYTVAETGSGDKRFCVYRKGQDNEPFGDTLGCHESREKAQAQIGAIWASENASKSGVGKGSPDSGNVSKAATIKNRARRMLIDLTALLADKALPERVRRAMEDVPAALRATWADLGDEANLEDNSELQATGESAEGANVPEEITKADGMENAAQRIADKIGNDPGFFTACRDLVSGWSWVTDAEGLCAMAHKIVVGTWPGEKQGSVAKAQPRITFVAASPGHLEAARQEAMVGPSGKVFKSLYLEPLGLTREDTRLLFVVDHLLLDEKGKVREPDEDEIEGCQKSLHAEIDSGSPMVVVALGQVARGALAGRADFTLPHPTAVRLMGDSGEVARKLKQIRKALNATQPLDDSERPGSRVSKEYTSTILKADDEKQEIYGVVLEPDTVDEQNDTISADEIAKAAHNFLVKSRVVGDGHKTLAPVEVIESYTAPANMTVGEQTVKSGSWVIGVHVSDAKLWKSVKQGEYSGFSVGGWANRESA